MVPGTRLGPYEIIEAIGHGGMGEVYRARDARLQRDVAIKTVAARAVTTRRSSRGSSAKRAPSRRCRIPTSSPSTTSARTSGTPYVAMELLEGATLRSLIGSSPLPLATAVDYSVQIGSGLAAAHDRGIIHRDLKPENVFVTRDGRVKLLDFGLATEPDALSDSAVTRLGQTEQGMVLGTAGYMSPEQARGERTGARSDIFAFGCVLYEMLAGRPAFRGDGRIETLHAVLKDHPSDLAALRPDVPPALERVVRRCLEKTPERRFQNARDLVFALETLTHASDAAPSSSAPSVPPARTTRRAAIPALVIVVLLGAAVVAWKISRGGPAAEPASAAAGAEGRRRMLAVLPFDNISRDRDAYFAAGMTEEITSRLSQLSALRVAGRAAVAQFKDPRTQLAAMARDLGIGSVVAGTVREDGGRVRVNVELIEAQSGQVLWSDQYDREGLDVFAAQSDIALHVSEALKASVTLEEQARIGKRPTSSVAAYELFMRARTAPGKTSEDRRKAAIDLLWQAVAIDPRFAEAYSAIANNYYFLGAYGDLSALPRGLDAAHKALEIDPQLGSAHETLALNLQQMGRLQEALTDTPRRCPRAQRHGSAQRHQLRRGHRRPLRWGADVRQARARAGAQHAGRVHHVGAPLLLLDDDARTERFLTAAAARFASATQAGVMRLEILLAFLDLRRRQAAAAVARMEAAAGKAPDNIEVLLTRAEMTVFAGTPDAPRLVRELMGRAGDGLFHNAPYPVKLAHAYYLQRSGDMPEALTIFNDVLEANRKAVAAGADSPLAFMQNAAVHALRGETNAALDDLDRAYAAGWRDGLYDRDRSAARPASIGTAIPAGSLANHERCRRHAHTREPFRPAMRRA